MLLLHKGALTYLLITCTFKDRNGIGHGFIECDLTGLHNSASFKVKNTICMRVRNITKKIPLEDLDSNLSKLPYFRMKHLHPNTLK